MTETRVLTREIDVPVVSRPVPITHVLVTATSSGSAQTVATVRANVMLKIRQLSVANITGSAATLFLNAIPASGSIGDSNAEAKGVSIAANSINDLTPYIGGLYTAGMALKVYSGTGSALVIHGWAEEIL